MILKEPILVVVDDEEDGLALLEQLGRRARLRTTSCRNKECAIAAIDEFSKTGDLVGVVTDLKLSKIADDGWAIIDHAYRVSKTLRLALYTAWAKAPVQKLFKSGAAVPAFTVFGKNEDEDKLQQWMAEARTSWDDSFALTLKDADTRHTYHEIAPIYARSELPILLLGETGTGKESLAKHIHDISGRRGEFVPINCGGLEPSLAFSELFGHTAGAFTDAQYHELGLILRASGYMMGRRPAGRESQDFLAWLRSANPDLEERDGMFHSRTAEQSSGTLFLDEVATLPPKVMAGLLRVLSTGDVLPFGHHSIGIRSYCRILAATNEIDVLRNSINSKETETVRFRRDLCYRLGGAVLTLAPLRERDADDIRHYVEKVVWGQLKLPAMPVDHWALDYIVELYQSRTDDIARQYQLGNFRTLRNLVHRAVLIARAENVASIGLTHLEIAVQHGELRVEDSAIINQDNRIRDVFRKALQERNLDIDKNFSVKGLAEFTRKNPVAVGFAFLRCALMTQDPPHPHRKYYTLADIENALTNGMSKNIWLNKGLHRQDVLQAAIDYFGLTPPDSAQESLSISEIVRHVQEIAD